MRRDRNEAERFEMAAREESPQYVRAQVWLGMAQLGAGLCRDAEATFRAARRALQREAPERGWASDSLDLQLEAWIARSRGN
jgi:hypothetical protein